jgi:hypothetical protein
MTDYTFASDDIVACICEGAVEVALINILLNGNKLKFQRENLLTGSPLPPKYRKGKIFSDQYLGMNHRKKIKIVVVQDGNEKFKLSKTYLKKIEEPILYVKTKPEIEMLLIHKLGYYEEFMKVKTTKKPSVFLQEKLKKGSAEVKSSVFVNNMFNEDSLVEAIKMYHSKTEHKLESMKNILL